MATSPTPPPKPQALTLKANGRLDRIISDISVSPAFDPAATPSPAPKFISSKALWDTGATRSVISQQLAKDLALEAVGAVNVNHGGGVGTSPTYLVNFRLPNRVGFVGVLVTEFPAPADGSFSVILGMDVITVGDFAITNVDRKTWVSFKAPSTERVDYVAELNRSSGFSGVGRNAPCPCGSGKKYKKCCGLVA